MSICRACGAKDQFTRFCVSCGANLEGAPPASENPWGRDGPGGKPGTGSGFGGDPGATVWAGPPPGSGEPVAPAPARKRPWSLIAASAVVVVLLAVGGGIFFFSTATHQAGSGSAASPQRSLPAPVVPPPATRTVTQTSTRSLTSVLTTSAHPSVNPPATTTGDYSMGGPGAPFACNSGYIVQIASALAQADYRGRIAQIRIDGSLPSNAKWTQTSTTCPIFAGTSNAYVLYAGPFSSAYDACATRLASPPDAFIRSTVPGATEYVSCLCPTAVSTLPAVGPAGSSRVWVGELQWVLRHLKYPIDDLDGPPSAWGTFTAGTQAAVTRFQTDNGLPATGVVDGATWANLQTNAC